MQRSRSQLSAIMLMIQAATAFSLMALCVKLTSASLPSLEIVFFRSFIGMLMILWVMRQKRISLFGQKKKLLVLRGILGFLALSLHFYTIAHLPLGTAFLLNYTSPIFSAILAVIFLKERPSALLLVMIGLSFWGVYLLIGGQFTEWNLFVNLGLVSAVFAAGAYIVIRAIKHHESPFTIMFYFTAISSLGAAFYLPFGFAWPNSYEWLLLLGVGIFSFYGQLWMTIALRRATASLVSPFSYLGPALTFFYDFLLFGIILSWKSLAGAALIIAGGSLITWAETKIKKAPVPTTR